MSLSPKENGDLPASQMTKREMMAMHMMQGILGSPWARQDNSPDMGSVARAAIMGTNALLDELAEEIK